MKLYTNIKMTKQTKLLKLKLLKNKIKKIITAETLIQNINTIVFLKIKILVIHSSI